jgi:hypothetical protein
MRIAILLSGFVRVSTSLLENLKTHVIEPNVKRGVTVDLYSCVWDLEGTISVEDQDPGDPRICEPQAYTGKYRVIKNDPLNYDEYTKFLETLGASNVFSKKMCYMDEATGMLNFINQNKPWTKQNNISRHLWLRSVHYGIKQAFGMIEDPSTYDFVVRTRTGINYGHEILFEPDAVTFGSTRLSVHQSGTWDNPHINIARQVVGRHESGTGCLFLPFRDHDDNKYIDDHFAIGRPESMKVYASFYDCAERLFDILWYWPHISFNNETGLLLHLVENNVKLVTFPKVPLIQRLPLTSLEEEYIRRAK